MEDAFAKLAKWRCQTEQQSICNPAVVRETEVLFAVYPAPSPIIVEEIDYIQVRDVKTHSGTVSN